MGAARQLVRRSVGPPLRVLGALVAAVLLVHAALLLGVDSPLNVRLAASPVPGVQMRVLAPVTTPVQVRPRARPVATAAVSAPPLAAAAEVAETDETTVQPQPEPPPAPAPEAPQTQASEAMPASSVAEAAQQQLPGLAPLVSLGALPPSRLLSYELTGMDKGLTYHAGGELRWQHNDSAYELVLSVRAFLIGSRHWRSVGQIDATGLVPRRFSDSWRNERAAHFDRQQQRVVFSSNSTPVPLMPGAQDQVSLYVQLAAAMAGEPERFVPGTRLQVQTATVRDALPWSLQLQGGETMVLHGEPLQVSKWVCQPRSQYDARVEFWVTAQQAWLPVRIRITQASGSYIDLRWRGTEPLPPLPVGADTTARAGAS